MMVKEMWLLQTGLCEGTEACQRPFFFEETGACQVLDAFVFALLGQ
jgi:hypothetical protein